MSNERETPSLKMPRPTAAMSGKVLRVRDGRVDWEADVGPDGPVGVAGVTGVTGVTGAYVP